MLVAVFGQKKIGVQKIVFQDKFYSLKAHAHQFTALIYLATWTAAKLGIFTHFKSRNVTPYSQNVNSLMYVYHTDPQRRLFMNAWSQSWSHFFVLAMLKNNVCINPCSSTTSTKFKDILPRFISKMVTKTIAINTRIVITFALYGAFPSEFDRKSMETKTLTWTKFPTGDKAIVLQILASEERNTSKRAGLWESQSGIWVGKSGHLR